MPMKLFDAHNHLQDERFDLDRPMVLERAAAAGVSGMAVCGTTEANWADVASLAMDRSEIIPCYGLHPWWVAARSPQWRDTLVDRLQRESAAVGEIGLDFAVEDLNVTEQESVFLEQLRLSREYNRPAIIHCRKAWERMLELLTEAGPHPVGILLHAYSGGASRIDALVELNAWFSFSASVTYPNNRRGPLALRAVPRDRLLLESDAPDMPPAEVERNEPAYLCGTLRAAARHLACPEDEIAQLTRDNALRLFEEVLR